MDNQEITNFKTVSDTHQLVIPARDEDGTLSYEGNPVKEKTMAFLGAVAVTGILVLTVVIGFDVPKEETVNVAPLILESIPKPPITQNPYYTLELEAKSVIVYDVNHDEVLFGMNEDQQLPLASLTKLMTALLAVETFDLKSNIAIAPEALAIEGDSGLFANETWKVGDLVSFMMLSSSNDGAGALAAAAGSLWESPTQVANTTSTHSKMKIFVDKMNIRAKELGLKDTAYTNPTGLDDQATGGLGTASDMAHLMTYIWEKEPEAIYQTNKLQNEFVSEDNFSHKAENTNDFVNTVSGIMGSKTGYTDLAGGNLAIIYDAGMDNPIVVVVLGSSLNGRFKDTSLLVDATSEYIESGWYEYEKMAGSTAGSTSEFTSSS